MRRGRLLLIAVSAAGLAGGAIASSALHAGALATPLAIGLDNATPSPCAGAATGTLPPACHNFGYNDFFPDTGITIHNGDVLNFQLNQGAADAFHTTTLLKPGETEQNGRSEFGLVAPDSDTGDAAGQLQLNPAILAPTTPGCGSSAASPCTYNGSGDLNSGVLLNTGGPQGQVFDKVTLPVSVSLPATITFICLVHPGMVGTFTVAPAATPASTQAQLTAAAQTQFTAETSDALAAETAANSASKTTNANGTSTWNLTAGVDGANGDAKVQVLEMLPASISIKPGDTVHWAAKSSTEPHTITFPQGSGSNSVDPIPGFCEGGSGDTPGTGPPPTLGCSNPSLAELHFDPQPQGTSQITTPTTVGSSGVVTPSGFSFSFPSQAGGTFLYQCRIHNNMFGAVQAAAVTIPTIPNTGLGGKSSLWLPLLLLGIGLVLVGTAVTPVAVRRRRVTTRR